MSTLDDQDLADDLWRAGAGLWAAQLRVLRDAAGGCGPYQVTAVHDVRRGGRHDVTFDIGVATIELIGVQGDEAVLVDVDVVGGVHGDPQTTVVAVRHRDGRWSTVQSSTLRCLTA